MRAPGLLCAGVVVGAVCALDVPAHAQERCESLRADGCVRVQVRRPSAHTCADGAAAAIISNSCAHSIQVEYAFERGNGSAVSGPDGRLLIRASRAEGTRVVCGGAPTVRVRAYRWTYDDATRSAVQACFAPVQVPASDAGPPSVPIPTPRPRTGECNLVSARSCIEVRAAPHASVEAQCGDRASTTLEVENSCGHPVRFDHASRELPEVSESTTIPAFGRAVIGACARSIDEVMTAAWQLETEGERTQPVCGPAADAPPPVGRDAPLIVQPSPSLAPTASSPQAFPASHAQPVAEPSLRSPLDRGGDFVAFLVRGSLAPWVHDALPWSLGFGASMGLGALAVDGWMALHRWAFGNGKSSANVVSGFDIGPRLGFALSSRVRLEISGGLLFAAAIGIRREPLPRIDAGLFASVRARLGAWHVAFVYETGLIHEVLLDHLFTVAVGADV